MESVLARVAALEQALSDPSALLSAATTTGGTAAPSQGTETAPEAATAPGQSSFAQALQSATASYQSASGDTPATTAESSATGTADTALGTANPALAATSSALGLTGSPSSDAALTTPGMTGTAGYGSTDATGLTPDTLAATYPSGLTTASTSLGVSGAASSDQGYGARIVAIAESQAGQAEEPLGSNEGRAVAEYRTATAGAIPGAPWCAYFVSWAARQAGEPLGAHGEGLGAVSEIWSWAQSTGRAIPNGPGVTPKPGDLIVFGDEHVGIVKDVLPNGDIQTIEGNYENKVALNVRTPTEATGYVNME